MKLFNYPKLFFIYILVLGGYVGYSQVKWMSFEQLDDSLAVQPKKVFINFYADWCAYCKKMDEAAFSDKKIIKELNTSYYAVKMNAESKDTIVFGGKQFINREVGQKRNPTHDIPLLLGSREEVPFSLPLIIILNDKFQVEDRYFEYIAPQKMKSILKL